MFLKNENWVISSIVKYLVEVEVEKVIVDGVETLDEVDADEDVETELEVDTLQRKFKLNHYYK